jgi:hypothetical protein
VHAQRLALDIGDADHVHVGQPDEQRAHAPSIALHTGSPGSVGVATPTLATALCRARGSSGRHPTPPADPRRRSSRGIIADEAGIQRIKPK